MPRKNRSLRYPEDAATRSSVHGACITELPPGALVFWLGHFTNGTPTRAALIAERNRRIGL